MNRKNRKTVMLWTVVLIVCLLAMPWAAQLARADVNVQLVELKWQFGDRSESKTKLNFLGYNVDREKTGNAQTVLWVGLSAIAIIAIVVDKNDNHPPPEKPKCHFIIVGGESTRVCD